MKVLVVDNETVIVALYEKPIDFDKLNQLIRDLEKISRKDGASPDRRVSGILN